MISSNIFSLLNMFSPYTKLGTSVFTIVFRPFKFGFIGETKKGVFTTISYSPWFNHYTLNEKLLEFPYISEVLSDDFEIYTYLLGVDSVKINADTNELYLDDFYYYISYPLSIENFVRILNKTLPDNVKEKINKIYIGRPQPKNTFSYITVDVKLEAFSRVSLPINPTSIDVFKKSILAVDHNNETNFTYSITNSIIYGDELISGEGIFTDFYVAHNIIVVNCDDAEELSKLIRQETKRSKVYVVGLYINCKSGLVGANGWMDLTNFSFLSKHGKLLKAKVSSNINELQYYVTKIQTINDIIRDILF